MNLTEKYINGSENQMIDIDSPDEVMYWLHAFVIRFRTNANNRLTKVSLDCALEISKDYDCMETFFRSNPLSGTPGDGFIKDRKGIYAFVSIDYMPPFQKKILYIGKASKLRQRILQHYANPLIINKMIDSCEDDYEIYVWYVEDNETLERMLIEKFNPKYNTHYLKKHSI